MRVLPLVAVLVLGYSSEAASFKPAWEWNDEERLALRFDPASIRERSTAEATEPYGAIAPNRSSRLRTNASDESVPNIVVGRRNPELMMPFELFPSLIRDGFSEVATERASYRARLAPIIEEVARPEDFWSALESAAAAYIDYQHNERALFTRLNAPDADRDAVRRELSILQQPSCRLLHDALVSSYERIGRTPLLRVLYRGIAPTMTISAREPESPARYRFIAGGCQ